MNEHIEFLTTRIGQSKQAVQTRQPPKQTEIK
jgi:hypothetical protein